MAASTAACPADATGNPWGGRRILGQRSFQGNGGLVIRSGAESLRGGQVAAAIMSLIPSAGLNGHDPYADLKDVPTRLSTPKNHKSDELLPHWGKPTD
jgi:hypothetical protein